jgi:hypothetical protein
MSGSSGKGGSDCGSRKPPSSKATVRCWGVLSVSWLGSDSRACGASSLALRRPAPAPPAAMPRLDRTERPSSVSTACRGRDGSSGSPIGSANGEPTNGDLYGSSVAVVSVWMGVGAVSGAVGQAIGGSGGGRRGAHRLSSGWPGVSCCAGSVAIGSGFVGAPAAAMSAAEIRILGSADSGNLAAWSCSGAWVGCPGRGGAGCVPVGPASCRVGDCGGGDCMAEKEKRSGRCPAGIGCRVECVGDCAPEACDCAGGIGCCVAKVDGCAPGIGAGGGAADQGCCAEGACGWAVGGDCCAAEDVCVNGVC